MHRSQIIRVARTSLRPVFLNPASLSRAYTLSGQETPNPKAKQADNTLMYTTLGVVAAASAYYYFRNTDEAQELKDRAKADQDRMRRKSGELADAAKTRAEVVKQQGKAKLDQVKTGSKEKLDSAQSIAEREAKETETRGRGLVADLEAKYDSVKGSAGDNLTRARDSTENLYNEARLLTEQKAADARDDTKKKIDQAKNGWFSWFHWGKSKADDIESEAEHLRGKEVANKERGEKDP